MKADLDKILPGGGEKAFLLRELRAVRPSGRVGELAGYQKAQKALGGGFYGLMPAQLEDLGGPEMRDSRGDILRAAVVIVRQRQENLAVMKDMKRAFSTTFAHGRLPPLQGDPPPGMSLDLDDSVVSGFLVALKDGRVTRAEARAIAGLPANREMLKHRRELGYIPPPLPTEESLAEMIRMAGSRDLLDQLWCWINPHNCFDFADIVRHRKDYDRLLADVRENRTRIVGSVLSRIAIYAPRGIHFKARICLTVEPWIRGWATADTAGINIEHFKDDWNTLLSTVTHEVYHRLQLQMCLPASGRPAANFEDLAAADLGDPRYDRLYEIVAYAALEGSASLVGQTRSGSTPDEGARLMKTFIEKVVGRGDCSAADPLIHSGLKANGPLYALGLYCARLVAEHDGTRAVGALLTKGPEKLILRALELDARRPSPVVGGEVRTSLKAMEDIIVLKSSASVRQREV